MHTNKRFEELLINAVWMKWISWRSQSYTDVVMQTELSHLGLYFHMNVQVTQGRDRSRSMSEGLHFLNSNIICLITLGSFFSKKII